MTHAVFAIEGMDCTGKTTLAAQVGDELRARRDFLVIQDTALCGKAGVRFREAIRLDRSRATPQSVLDDLAEEAFAESYDRIVRSINALEGSTKPVVALLDRWALSHPVYNNEHKVKNHDKYMALIDWWFIRLAGVENWKCLQEKRAKDMFEEINPEEYLQANMGYKKLAPENTTLLAHPYPKAVVHNIYDFMEKKNA